MAIQYGKGGVKDHITSRCPLNALFCRVVLESKDIYISGEERRNEAHHARYSCTITLVRENSRSGIRKVWQQCLRLSIHGECLSCSQPNRRMILKNNQIDGRTINFNPPPPPFFCANMFDTSLLLIVCALR